MNEIKKFFPIFKNSPKIIYLDSGASAQKPLSVIDGMNEFYSEGYANIHRGLYPLSEKASLIYDEVREKVAVSAAAISRASLVIRASAPTARRPRSTDFRFPIR